ncbi:hypothetical protein FHS96_003689 [Sphingomonas zeicaulis]|uniref:hypothetical protein n=1 Tax=Sphingomonas zeicaulis TaxID=1632740 RepID=UPI003D1F0A47
MAGNGFVERATRLIGCHLEEGRGIGGDSPMQPHVRNRHASYASQETPVEHRALARAFLAALREPTAPMISAGARTIEGLQPTPEAMAETIWQRMIDAALDEIE